MGRHEVVRARTGLRIDGYFSGSKLQWLMRERPELARKLALGTALIGTIDTYLIYRLTGARYSQPTIRTPAARCCSTFAS